MMLEAIVESYKRFEIHDGPGIRTTVFLKGCPLRCAWCHNPECISSKPELGFKADKCVSCGKCVQVCEKKAHILQGQKHVTNRSLCVQCGKCVEVCPVEALVLHGKMETVDTVLEKVLEDRIFYGETGGVTVSGGEPLMQGQFVLELLKRLKSIGVNTAIDTSLYGKRELLEQLVPYTDIFLVDIKAFDTGVHLNATGVKNGLILSNIGYLDSVNAKTEIRIPFVPGYNDREIDAIGAFIAKLRNINVVKILPYHSYGNSKYYMLGKTPSDIAVPDNESIIRAKGILRSYGITILD